MAKFKWHEQRRSDNPIYENDIRMVELPVKVAFTWSDKIIDDVDDEGEIVSYKSGWLMNVFPEVIVYNNQKTVYLASSFKENTSELKLKVTKLVSRAMEDTRGLDAKYPGKKGAKGLTSALNSILDHAVNEILITTGHNEKET